MAYKTGWIKKVISGVSTKVFAFAHAKTVYTDYANGTTLDEVLIETEDFDQTAVTESDISPVILSKLNSLQSTQSDNFTLLNENKADASDTYTKKEVDNLVGTSTVVTGTLTAGQTSITLTDDSINENSTIEPYTSVYGVNPKTITVSNGSVTLTFKSQTVDIGVKVVVK